MRAAARAIRFGAGVVAMAASLLTATSARAQAPKAKGETLVIQNYAGSTGNMHAVIASAKGFCDKYNFKCDVRFVNTATLGLQALVGKTIDVAQTGTVVTAQTLAAGGDVVIVGISLPNTVLSISVRSDVPMPNKAKGYPEIMKDFKGLKIGEAARNVGEQLFNVMLKEVGLTPNDVTYVAVGTPATAYSALVIGKQVDAVIMYQPLTQLCQFNKTCETVIDFTAGEGPPSIKGLNGASVPFVMRREMVETNPQLALSFQAAMKDAAVWFNDPANFEELIKIYTPLVSFGDMPGADELRRSWIKSVIPAYSKDLSGKVSAVKATIEFYTATKDIDKPVDTAKLLWDKMPTTP